MLQREMAHRLAARPGPRDYGVASVLVQAFAAVRIAFRVSRRSFLPVPEVDSAVIDVRWSPAPRVDVDDVAAFRAVVRAAFGQRRKMLRNALGALAAARGLTAEEACARAGVDPATRAERLDLAAFARLARALGV
jgi:16S rRNA (adenine1518-N6/adenine1519-N6)-dimethyltransferase